MLQLPVQGNLRDQMHRAVHSVVLNAAEGGAQASEACKRKHFRIARASLWEVAAALDALRQGTMVLVYDAEGREEETDMMMPSQFVTPETIRTMRQDAGGLICTTMSAQVRETLGLPYLSDLIQSSAERFPALSGLIPNDIPYDEVSAFSLTINLPVGMWS